MTKNKLASPNQSESSNLEETAQKQSFVTQRMIGMHRGRTRIGRLFKILSAMTLCFALAGTAWWVLPKFKEPDHSWGEMLLDFAQKIIG